MVFYDEVFYEITLKGLKSELKKFVDFLFAGGLEDFIEIEKENIIYGDTYKESENSMITDITLINEDGFSVEEFDVEEFLELFCQHASRLDVYGFIYDADEVEYRFTSEAGNDYFSNARNISKFNDELDDIRDEEEDYEE